MSILITLSFLFSVGALVYAVRAHRMLARALSIIESKHARTVTIDHTDGRITVLQQSYEPTDLQRPSV